MSRAPAIRLADATRDAAAGAAIYAPSVKGSCISFEAEPPDAATMGERIANIGARFPWLVGERGGGVAGYVYACAHRERAAYRWAVDVAVYVSAEHHRAGVGRGLYTSLFALLRLQGFRIACAGVALPNAGSVALHEAFGFEPVGVYRRIGFKLGGWRDVGWWQLALNNEPWENAAAAEPPEPLGMAALQAHPEFAAALSAGLPLIRP